MAGGSQLDASALRAGCILIGIHTFIKTRFFLLFSSTTLSLCLSHTLNIIISLNYKLE